jgi:hypothetical protein
MPYGDGTGPFGKGPMTGKRMGSCAHCSYCARCPFCRKNSLNKEERLKFLKEEKEMLEKEIANVEKSK